MEDFNDKNILDQPENTNKSNPTNLWFKRLGAGAFLFFLAKGIVWLFVIFGVGKCALN